MSDNNKNSKFSLASLPRVRWNLVDLVSIVARDTVPTYLFLDIDMTWAESLRQRFARLGHKTTVTALLLKAIAIAQKEHPDTRTVMLPFGRTVTFNKIVAGFTVERYIEKQPALFFGAIEEPDAKSVQAISNELKAHAEEDLEKVYQLNLQNRFTKFPWVLRRLMIWVGMRDPGFRLMCMGATFGLSSLGKFGLSAMIPPCVTTSMFGIGKVEERPVVREGKVEVRNMLTVTLNFDHRLLDGAPAARFLKDIQTLMEGGLEKYVQEELRELQLLASNISDKMNMNTGSLASLDATT